MAVINWGKPKLEICKLVNGEIPADSPEWKVLDTPVDGTTTLEMEEGDKTEALEEGGGVVDTYVKKGKISLSFELYEKKGAEKPIEDNDGIVSDNYAVRLTPEDSSCNGYILKKCAVSFTQSYTAADGGRWKYTFDALTPSTGKMLETYNATEV